MDETQYTMNELRRPSIGTSVYSASGDRPVHSNPGLPLVREPTVPVQERPSWSTNAEREYNKVSQQNTNNNKKTSHKSKFIKYSFRKIKDKMHISPLFYSNKIFIADTKNYGSSLHSSFEIDRSGEEVITPRRNSKEMYGYRPRSISI